jgi:hypothetical protein
MTVKWMIIAENWEYDGYCLDFIPDYMKKQLAPLTILMYKGGDQ